MKLSQNTLTLLKNFTAINKGIVLHPGNKLYSRKESLIADATITETIEKEVGIFDLSQLLNIIGLYDDPVLDFGDDCLRIAETDGKAETKYVYAAPGIVSGGTIPKQKVMQISEDGIDFVLTEDQWTKLQKAISILSVPEVKVTSDGKVVRIETVNHKNTSGSSFSIVLDADAHGIQCNMVYNRDDMPLLKGSYTGKVGPKFTIFKNTSGYDLTYVVGVEPTTSTFGTEDEE
jgi:hypothetical protein